MDTTTGAEEMLKHVWNNNKSPQQPWEWAFDVAESLPEAIVESQYLTSKQKTAGLEYWHTKMIAIIDEVVQRYKADLDKDAQLQFSWENGPFDRQPLLDWMRYHQLQSITVKADGALTYVREDASPI